MNIVYQQERMKRANGEILAVLDFVAFQQPPSDQSTLAPGNSCDEHLFHCFSGRLAPMSGTGRMVYCTSLQGAFDQSDGHSEALCLPIPRREQCC